MWYNRRFGIATDVQYADIDDGFSHGGVPRFYRGALRGLRRAVAAWREQQVEFAIHLGDIIDGCARAIETVWFFFLLGSCAAVWPFMVLP